MPLNDAETSTNDSPAIATGLLVGMVAGGGLGGGIVLLMGSSAPEVWAIVMIHSVIAMMVMGAWTAPSLLAREE